MDVEMMGRVDFPRQVSKSQPWPPDSSQKAPKIQPSCCTKIKSVKIEMKSLTCR